MNELDKWMKLLLDKGVSVKGLREFKTAYQDIVFSSFLNDDIDELHMLDVIGFVGDEDEESETIRRYLCYVYGKFVSADIYAGCIGKAMSGADDEWRMLLDSIIEDAIKQITK
jgi:hypothetical protein